MIVNCGILDAMKTVSPRFLSVSALAGCALALSACSGASESADGVSVAAAFYPLQFVTEQVGGDHVSVEGLTAAGADSHDLELTPQMMAQVSDADVVVYLSGFQPAVDEAVELQAPETGFDVASVTELLEHHGHDHDHDGDHDHDHDHDHDGDDGHAHDHGGLDPHVWLDPAKFAEIASAVADRLADVDPDNADDYTANAEALTDRLTDLDASYTTALADCDSRDIVTSHAAFGYLADRYDLHQVSVAGLTPDATPTADAIREVADYVTEHGVTTVFYETAASPDVADTVAAETGAQTAVLDPIETLVADSGDDYFSIMEANRDTLAQALGCSA